VLRKIIKSPSFKTISLFAGGNFIAAAISGISGILYARWISPDVLGEFSKFGILTGYLGFGLIFVHGALPRQYPFLIGKGQKEEALRIAAAAKWWYLMFSWLGTIIFTVLTVYCIFKHKYRPAIGWGTQIPALWMAIYGQYLQTMYRSSNDFKKLSFNQLLTSFISFGLLLIVKFWSYWGFVLRFAVINYSSLQLHKVYVPEKVKTVFDLKRLKSLAKMSLPLSIPAYIDTYLLKSSISFLILYYLGERQLGVYAMAITLQSVLMIFPRAIHQIYITKITIKYGETENVKQCLAYSKIPTILSFFASAISALLFTLLIGPLISIVIPKYIDSIPILQITIWQLPLFASGLAFIVFSSALWYKEMISLRIMKSLTNILLIFILPKNIINIGWSIIISDILFFSGGYLVMYFKVNKVQVVTQT